MARRFRSFSRPLRQGQRRATEWLFSVDVATATTLAAATAVFNQQFAVAEPATAIRTRGNLWVASD